MVRRGCLLAAALLGLMAGCGTPPGALRIDASTYRARGQDSRVLFLILHYTDGTMARAVNTLTTQDVSAHYLLSDETPPRIYRLVDEDRRAWHAGVSFWQNHGLLNASSIGIEIVNPGRITQPDGSTAFAPFPPAQIEALLPLIKDIVTRHQIRLERILGHSDIAPQRRVDPGPQFPWHRLAAEGLIPWPDAAQVAQARAAFEAQLPEVAWFQRALANVGYRVPQHGQLDEETRKVIVAFQMKYRPSRHDGQPDAETAAMLQVLGAAP